MKVAGQVKLSLSVDMDIQAALVDMQEAIQSISWVDVVALEDQNTGNKNLVTIVPAGIEEEFNFGSVKRMHSFNMTLYSTAKDTNPATVQSRVSDINKAILADRHRNGNALTTISGSWSDGDNEGRELITMISEVQIHLLENC